VASATEERKPAQKKAPHPMLEGDGGDTRRVRTPTVLQMEAVECGAACLSMVLAHRGRHVPLEQLRIECGVSRDGTNAGNLLRAAKSHGLAARGFQLEADILRNAPLPAIAFWNFDHFVVVEGFKGDTVYINDPATGPRKVTWEEFDGSFTGIALLFEPGEGEVERTKKPSGTLRRLWTRMDQGRSGLYLILLLSFLLVVPGLALPGLQRVFVDQVLVTGRESWALPLAAGAGLAALLMFMLTALQQHYLLRLETRMAISDSAGFLRHVLRLPVEFFTQRQPADIAARMLALDRVAQILSRDLATAAVGTIMATFFAVVLVLTDVVLGLIGIGAALINLVALRLVGRIRRDATSRLEQDRGKVVSATYNGIALMETLKASGREADYFARWAGMQANMVTGVQRLGVPTQLLGIVPIVLTIVSGALILLVGADRVIEGTITVGLLLAVQTLVTQFQKPVVELADVGTRAQEASADIARLDDVERYPTARATRPRMGVRGRRRRLSGHLEMRDVTFGYNPLTAPLIEDFSLELRPGERIALVGPSGSGKSTVARLIAGLHEPWSGEILFDGMRRAEISREVLAASLGVVEQEPFLFAGTIRENLTLWDEGVHDDVLIAALRDAAIHDEIMGRPGKLSGMVGEGGRDLSGGQRQRVEIARALAGDPAILVLDEATSALDPVSEQRVDGAMRRRGCSAVIVAHRLSAIRDADEIIVLDRGKVVERGRHDDLMAAAGIYADLIRTV
jgi:NHLM bacteriocin system ABC transporter peptidase/ATP-binding protein